MASHITAGTAAMSTINQQQQQRESLAQQRSNESAALKFTEGKAFAVSSGACVRETADVEPKAPYFYYKDHSETPDRDPSEPITIPGRIPNFPAKLFAILSRPELSDIISWMPHGRSWKVHKPREFEVKVIPAYFDHSKYSSFIRQANGWGFRRVSTKGPDRHSHFHELFLRGIPHLIKLMKRPAAATRGAATPVDRPRHVKGKNSDPDFYIISQEHPLPESKRSLLAVDHSSSSHGTRTVARRTPAPIAPAPARLAALPSAIPATLAHPMYLPQQTPMLQHAGGIGSTQPLHPESPVLKPAAVALVPSRKAMPMPLPPQHPTSAPSSFGHQGKREHFPQPAQNNPLLSEEIDPLNLLLQDMYEEDQNQQNMNELIHSALPAPTSTPMAAAVPKNYSQQALSESVSPPPQPTHKLHMPQIVRAPPMASRQTAATVSPAQSLASAPQVAAMPVVYPHACEAAMSTTAPSRTSASQLVANPLLHLPSSSHGHPPAATAFSTSYEPSETTGALDVDAPLLDELFAAETLGTPCLW